ncbi:hypothetical protein FRC00_002194 [Tulasnella sp. 408]|nr:hypothetical protein FRC00_002194 [Tulasnella sp. 408]
MPHLYKVRQVAEGLYYLHVQTPPIVHGDFKTTNVLVTGDGVAKICDFGGSKRLGETNTGLTTAGLFQATVLYTAPEIIKDALQSTLQSDVYSFAWVALVISKVVWEKQTPSEEDYTELKDEFLWKLLRRCWNYDPRDRPAMIEVCGALASAQYGPSAASY